MYNNSQSVNIHVPCANGSNCTYDAVKDIQASVYVMAFTELSINISFIVGEYIVQIYDHTDCLAGAVLLYDTVSNTMTMTFQKKALNCTLSLAKYNYTYTPSIPGLRPMPLRNAARTYITTYFNGAEALSN